MQCLRFTSPVFSHPAQTLYCKVLTKLLHHFENSWVTKCCTKIMLHVKICIRCRVQRGTLCIVVQEVCLSCRSVIQLDSRYMQASPRLFRRPTNAAFLDICNSAHCPNDNNNPSPFRRRIHRCTPIAGPPKTAVIPLCHDIASWWKQLPKYSPSASRDLTMWHQKTPGIESPTRSTRSPRL